MTPEEQAELARWKHGYAEIRRVFNGQCATIGEIVKMIEPRDRRIDELEAAIRESHDRLPEENGFAMSDERKFPLIPNRSRDAAPGPLSIPWSVAEKAYGVYASRHGRGQTLERLAERGGFGVSEMDDMYPAWRAEVDEITTLKLRIVDLQKDADRWQKFIGSHRVRVIGVAHDGDFRHIGIELWSQYPDVDAEDSNPARDTVTAFVDAQVASAAGKQRRRLSDQRYGHYSDEPEIMGGY